MPQIIIPPTHAIIVSQLNPTTAYGDGTAVWCGNGGGALGSGFGGTDGLYRAWLLYDLSGVPPAAKIGNTSIDFQCFYGDYADALQELHLSSNVAFDTTLTWNNAPNGSVSGIVSTSTPVNGNGTYSIFSTFNNGISKDVQNQLGNGKIAWRMQVNDESYDTIRPLAMQTGGAMNLTINYQLLHPTYVPLYRPRRR